MYFRVDLILPVYTIGLAIANINRNSLRLLCDYNNINISLIKWGKTEVATGCGSGVSRHVASVVGLVLVACRVHSFDACSTSMASSSWSYRRPAALECAHPVNTRSIPAVSLSVDVSNGITVLSVCVSDSDEACMRRMVEVTLVRGDEELSLEVALRRRGQVSLIPSEVFD